MAEHGVVRIVGASAVRGIGVSARPLAGLKVLDLAWVVAGPLVGRALAEFGADVVRVESSARVETARLMGPFPDGVSNPEQSVLYDNCNVGKYGLALDMSKPEARAVALDLAVWADVVIESFMPGQMEKFGLGYDAIRERNPGVIMLRSSLMGQSGPYSRFAGYGNIGAALAGYQLLVGQPDQDPVGPFGPYTDYIGPRFGLVTLLAAISRRRLSGEGCCLDLSQVESGFGFILPELIRSQVTGEEPARLGNRHPQMTPHGVFRCAGEDAWVAIAVRDDRDWQQLESLLGDQTLAGLGPLDTLPQRRENEAVLEQRLEQWIAGQSGPKLVRLLLDMGVPAAIVANSQDFVGDQQLLDRGHLQRMEREDGSVSVFEASRLSLSETSAEYARTAPSFGRDNHFVLSDILGYSDSVIGELSAAGALR